MQLSRERAEHVAGNIVAALSARGDLLRIGGDRVHLAGGLAHCLLELLGREDAITQEAMAKVASYSRSVTPGSSEWELLVAKHKEEIAARQGYVLG